MAIKPKQPGITRLSESDGPRDIKSRRDNTNQKGKFCSACRKWHPYMRQEQKLCRACDSRRRTLRG